MAQLKEEVEDQHKTIALLNAHISEIDSKLQSSQVFDHKVDFL